jgi:hypothetical protein
MCFFVREDLYVKEVKYLKDLCSEKEFEMLEVELVDFKCVVIYIYRSPLSDVYSFLNKLETLIGKVQLKRQKFILCKEWNISFLQGSVQLQDLHSILLSYNLTNTVTLPTRVTKNTSSITDVMIINKQYNSNSTEVVNLGYSDHFAQILGFLVNNSMTEWRKKLQEEILKFLNIYWKMNHGQRFI